MTEGSYVEETFNRDTNYITTASRPTPTASTTGRSSRAATGWSSPGPARGPTARSSCAGCSAWRTCSRWASAAPPTTRRSWTFDLDPGGVDPVLGIPRLQDAYFRRVPRLPERHHRARRSSTCRPGRSSPTTSRRSRSTSRREWRELPPRRRARPLPRGAARRDRRGRRADLHRGQQRRLPLRLRRLPGGLRQGLRPALRPRSTGSRSGWRRSATSSATRSPRPTCGCSPRWPASTPSTTATSSATGSKLTEMPVLWAYARDLFQTPGFGDTIDFVQIKQHYYIVHTDINPTASCRTGPTCRAGWSRTAGRRSAAARSATAPRPARRPRVSGCRRRTTRTSAPTGSSRAEPSGMPVRRRRCRVCSPPRGDRARAVDPHACSCSGCGLLQRHASGATDPSREQRPEPDGHFGCRATGGRSARATGAYPASVGWSVLVGLAGQGEHLVERDPGLRGDLGSTRIGLTTRPSTSDSSAQTRCGRSMRFIVEQ